MKPDILQAATAGAPKTSCEYPQIYYLSPKRTVDTYKTGCQYPLQHTASTPQLHCDLLARNVASTPQTPGRILPNTLRVPTKYAAAIFQNTLWVPTRTLRVSHTTGTPKHTAGTPKTRCKWRLFHFFAFPLFYALKWLNKRKSTASCVLLSKRTHLFHFLISLRECDQSYRQQQQ